MEKFWQTLAAQTRKPSGRLGTILGHWMVRSHRPLTRWAIAFLDLQPGHRVLDVGCGSGMAIQLLVEIAVDGFVAGVDYSEVMVRQARKRNATAVEVGRAEIVLGNISALPVDDQSFDRVVAIETFGFWPQPLANLKEVRRVLKPGGRVAVAMEESKEAADWQDVDAQKHKLGLPFRSGTELTQLLNGAGFGQVWYETESEMGRGWLCVLGVK